MDQFLGEIRLVAFDFAPQGWALCEGQLLPINQNQALFSLLGTYYGGDGKATFALPDMRGRVPLGCGQSSTGSLYAIGSSGGEESVHSSVVAPGPHGLLPAFCLRINARAIPIKKMMTPRAEI